MFKIVNTVVNFLSMHWNFARTTHAEFDAITLNINHRDDNVIADDDALSARASKNKHDLLLKVWALNPRVRKIFPTSVKSSLHIQSIGNGGYTADFGNQNVGHLLDEIAADTASQR
jgi:hypothetical protein